MKKVFLFFTLLLSLTLLASEHKDYSKYLKSQMRAEVYAQNLLDGGYYKEAKVFLKLARKKYTDDDELLMYSGTTHYNLDELDAAKKDFMLVLQNDSNNEIAADFIAKIEEQQAAQENKVVTDLFDYLIDKGLDFLMIFLAFLGGEIIAKKYHNCNTFGVSQSIQNYFNKEKLKSSKIFRLFYIFKSCCLSRRFLTMCTFLDTLIIFTISSAMLIVWLIIEITFDVEWFLPDALLTIDDVTMHAHIFNTFIVLTILTLIMQYIGAVEDISENDDDYTIEIAQQFQRLIAEQEMLKLHTTLGKLINHKNFTPQVIEDILAKFYSEDDKEIVANMLKDFNL